MNKTVGDQGIMADSQLNVELLTCYAYKSIEKLLNFPPSGIKNESSFCYINAMIQAVAASEIFIKQLEEMTSNNSSDCRSLNCLLDLLKGVNTSGNKIDTIIGNTKLMKDLIKLVDWNKPSQQDAFELFSALIKDIHIKTNIPMVMKTKLVHRFYNMNANDKIQDHLGLSLGLCGEYQKKPGVDLRYLIYQYFSLTLIDDNPEKETRIFFYDKVPEILLLHIQANKWDDKSGEMIKPEYYIKYEEEMELTLDVVSEGKEEKEETVKYRLKAVVKHFGNISGGHYVTYRVYKDDWYMISDEQVTKMIQMPYEKTNFLEHVAPYVMIYERIPRKSSDLILDNQNPPMTDAYLNTLIQIMSSSDILVHHFQDEMICDPSNIKLNCLANLLLEMNKRCNTKKTMKENGEVVQELIELLNKKKSRFQDVLKDFVTFLNELNNSEHSDTYTRKIKQMYIFSYMNFSEECLTFSPRGKNRELKLENLIENLLSNAESVNSDGSSGKGLLNKCVPDILMLNFQKQLDEFESNSNKKDYNLKYNAEIILKLEIGKAEEDIGIKQAIFVYKLKAIYNQTEVLRLFNGKWFSVESVQLKEQDYINRINPWILVYDIDRIICTDGHAEMKWKELSYTMQDKLRNTLGELTILPNITWRAIGRNILNDKGSLSQLPLGIYNESSVYDLIAMIEAVAASDVFVKQFEELKDNNSSECRSLNCFIDLLHGINKSGNRKETIKENTKLIEELTELVGWRESSQIDMFEWFKKLMETPRDSPGMAINANSSVPTIMKIVQRFKDNNTSEIINDNVGLSIDLMASYPDQSVLYLEKIIMEYFSVNETDRDQLFLFERAPDVLLIHFEIYEEYEKRKMIQSKYLVKYEKQMTLWLDVVTRVGKKKTEQEEVKYKLKAVVDHIEKESGGCFVTYRELKGNWYKTDDHLVMTTINQNWQSAFTVPYILIYERVESSFIPTSISLEKNNFASNMIPLMEMIAASDAWVRQLEDLKQFFPKNDVLNCFLNLLKGVNQPGNLKEFTNKNGQLMAKLFELINWNNPSQRTESEFLSTVVSAICKDLDASTFEEPFKIQLVHRVYDDRDITNDIQSHIELLVSLWGDYSKKPGVPIEDMLTLYFSPTKFTDDPPISTQVFCYQESPKVILLRIENRDRREYFIQYKQEMFLELDVVKELGSDKIHRENVRYKLRAVVGGIRDNKGTCTATLRIYKGKWFMMARGEVKERQFDNCVMPYLMVYEKVEYFVSEIFDDHVRPNGLPRGSKLSHLNSMIQAFSSSEMFINQLRNMQKKYRDSDILQCLLKVVNGVNDPDAKTEQINNEVKLLSGLVVSHECWKSSQQTFLDLYDKVIPLIQNDSNYPQDCEKQGNIFVLDISQYFNTRDSPESNVEQLNDVICRYLSSNAGANNDLNKATDFFRQQDPGVLILSICEDGTQREHRIKYEDKMTLQLDIYTSGDNPNAKGRTCTLKLKAIVFQKNDGSKGHDVTFRQWRGKWFIVDDDQVEACQFAADIDPCVMIYEKTN